MSFISDGELTLLRNTSECFNLLFPYLCFLSSLPPSLLLRRSTAVFDRSYSRTSIRIYIQGILVIVPLQHHDISRRLLSLRFKVSS